MELGVKPTSHAGARSSFLKRHVYQKLVTFYIDYIAEGAITATGEVEADAAVADPQVTHVEMVEEPRQHGIDDVQLFARSARADAEH